MMKALVLGGTGFIGRWIVRALIRRGTEVAVYHRGKTKAPEGVLVFEGHRDSFASHWPFMAAWQPDAIIDVRCMTLAELNQVAPQVRRSGARYVLISSIDVYRAFGMVIGLEQGREEGIITEKSALRSWLYPYSPHRPTPEEAPTVYDKIPVEEAARREFGPNAVVLRLPMVYGPGDRQRRLWPHLSRMKLERPWVVLSSSMAAWKSPRAFVGDVGEAAALCALHPFADGQIFHMAEPSCPTTQEWVERIAHTAGWKGEVRIVEDSRCPEWLLPQFNVNQPLVLDSTKIRSDLGYREVFNPSEAMSLAVKWELENPGPEPAVEELAREEGLVGIRGRKKAALLE